MWAWPPSPPPSERPSPRARVSACARDEVCILPDLIHASAHALSGRASAGRLFPPPDSAFVRSGRIRGVPPGVRCHCTYLKFNILPYLTLSQASRAPSRRLRLSRSAILARLLRCAISPRRASPSWLTERLTRCAGKRSSLGRRFCGRLRTRQPLWHTQRCDAHTRHGSRMRANPAHPNPLTSSSTSAR